MKKILITGGSGFIGSHLASRLVQAGYQVSNFDNQPPKLSEQHPLWRQIDILDRDELISAVTEAAPDAIVHLAARAEIFSHDWEDFASIHRGTRNLLDAIDANPGIQRLLNTSTQLVVGPGHDYRTDTEYHPYTTYGEAKAQAEQALRECDPKLTWCSLRPTNIWGPRHPSFGQSIWKYLARRHYLHPSTRSPVIRSYGYVGNTVDQYLALLQADPQAIHRQVFYIADGNIDSALWLDEFSRQLTGNPTRRCPLPLLRAIGKVGDVSAKIGHRLPLDSQRVMRMTTSYTVPLEPILELLSSPPAVDLKQGVRETTAWLRQSYPEIYASNTESR